MSEQGQICPYTGLRSFTEEESLYFKGREDDIDQATHQLQVNKFLMLTGASGDGKSSLIYAGIIPNARAGFLKAKYTQWCVADLRPERTPFRNLCKSIGRELGIDNIDSVQAELNHGFSAIIDLYKNSKRHIDTNSTAWQLADDKGKAALKREAANLIILVDQFEEFFTNPENYHRGIPSGDANLVLNLLLETARISLEEDLPVYVVFTMRSDYIGQCAAFRGLPEYIGFSQFFVPRLNRAQLQMVIEEPSVLSGNRISRRLTERLIHDITEGVDQLPILQHALNQIWHAADSGNEEMDLIHYAMVGGMPVDELPDEMIERFRTWFESLPGDIKSCYHKPNLQNVIDTHSNKLYEQANEYFSKKTGKTISEEDAKKIIKTAFTCLTKIDQSRAVRNRMTLGEIVNIIGNPQYGVNEVGVLLDIFREPGNTFVRPFILDESHSHSLKETDVLDITHESLIRNWRYLEQWAKEEFETYTVSLDFEQQLRRWVKSEKSNDFLLPIGPLTYFETWFNASKRNAHWIARYLPEEIDRDKKLVTAKQLLSNAQEFLSRSANKHVVTRTIMHYGAKRIAAAIGIIAVIILSSFGVSDYFRKKNDNVLKSIRAKTLELANLPKLSLELQVPGITEQLILGSLTIPQVVDAIHEPAQKIKIATAIATQLVYQGRNEPKNEILQSLKIADSLLERLTVSKNAQELSERLKLIHDFSVTAGLAYFLSHDDAVQSIVLKNATRSARWALQILKEQPVGFTDIQNLSLALDDGINHKAFTPDEINQLLGILSPFENSSSEPWVEDNYDKDKTLVRGNFNYGLTYNGLYQDLAYLYAAAGKPGLVLRAVDTLLKYQDNFYQNDYTTYVENAANIAAVFYIYETTSHIDDFVQGYCNRKGVTTIDFYNRLVSRALTDLDVASNANFYTVGGGQSKSNLNLKFSSEPMLSFFFAKFKEEIAKSNDADERNFNLAVALKNQGILFDFRKGISGDTEPETGQLYRDAINYYQKVSKEYLNQSIPAAGSTGNELITVSRKFLFIYPDYRVTFHPFEPRTPVQFYNSPAFIQFVLENNLFDSLYINDGDFKVFELWLLDYQVLMTSRDLFLRDRIPIDLMDRLATKLEERGANQYADLNILYLHFSDQAFSMGKPEQGLACLRKIQTDKLLNALQYKNFGFVNDYSFELIGIAIGNLVANDQFDLAYSILNVFKKEVNRSSLYGYASQLISLKYKSPSLALQMLDSARKEMNRLDNPAVFQPNRYQVSLALMYLDPVKNSAEAYRTIKNTQEKFQAIFRFSKAYGFHGNLYKADQQAPGLVSPGDKAEFLRLTINGFNLNEAPKKEWKKFLENQSFLLESLFPYVNESE